MWILVSTIIISCCHAKAMPVKRRMVLRLPFVHNQENSQTSFQQRTFLRMLNGNSKIKKAAMTSGDVTTASDDTDGENHLFMFRRIY
ncbi:hypothetical protein GCK72_008083 [Caenorhabditis remanei]|uniref:Uncharacterized protein n=1 Tax=Caenorhabditis remanei TaxID=31234 RepID=A0A6A5HLV4_CAERE|nr:hypothetical protein GCK72_008083 [Caenorhabditis remanei]KAF1768121.1 hypothetical protein GCK72_008083 [Caenorhabditis remanei]